MHLNGPSRIRQRESYRRTMRYGAMNRPNRKRKRVEVSPCNYFKFQSYAKARDFKHYDFLCYPGLGRATPTTGDAPDAGERSIDDESTIHRIPPAAREMYKPSLVQSHLPDLYLCRYQFPAGVSYPDIRLFDKDNSLVQKFITRNGGSMQGNVSLRGLEYLHSHDEEKACPCW